MMHRRQYIPGSHIKVSRARLARENKAIKDYIYTKAESERHAAEERQRIEREKQTTGLRGLLNKTKRWLTTPIRLRAK